MRVPVHPNDLLRHRGLKKLAKELQKQWRGPNPLTHTSALELLAQGLGYSDYQDRLSGSRIDPAKVSPLTIRMSVRWSAAMEMASVGNPLPIVAKRMGHLSVSMTTRYLAGTLETKRSD